MSDVETLFLNSFPTYLHVNELLNKQNPSWNPCTLELCDCLELYDSLKRGVLPLCWNHLTCTKLSMMNELMGWWYQRKEGNWFIKPRQPWQLYQGDKNNNDNDDDGADDDDNDGNDDDEAIGTNDDDNDLYGLAVFTLWQYAHSAWGSILNFSSFRFTESLPAHRCPGGALPFPRRWSAWSRCPSARGKWDLPSWSAGCPWRSCQGHRSSQVWWTWR